MQVSGCPADQAGFAAPTGRRPASFPDFPGADKYFPPKYKIFPGFADVHVHLREPGFFYKESIKTGTMAAAHGGYTDVCAMPNLDPVPDSPEHIAFELEAIHRDAVIRVHPYGSVTEGEKGETLSDFEGLSPRVVAFSDDGMPVASEELMRRAMEIAKKLGRVIAAHCEDRRFSGAESEWRQVERDLRLADETGCKYHVCHVSSKESVSLIREAKKSGVDVTCETAPHYLCLSEKDVTDDGRYKMNPPLGSERDREALIEGLADGTVDMIATDHAPHSAREKSGGFALSRPGVTGLETAFPVLYTYLVKPGSVSLERLIDAMSGRPRARFSLPSFGDYCVWDMEREYTIDPEKFYSKGRSTPFAGMRVFGKCVALICGGKTVWRENSTEK